MASESFVYYFSNRCNYRTVSTPASNPAGHGRRPLSSPLLIITRPVSQPHLSSSSSSQSTLVNTFHLHHRLLGPAGQLTAIKSVLGEFILLLFKPGKTYPTKEPLCTEFDCLPCTLPYLQKRSAENNGTKQRSLLSSAADRD